MFALTSGSKLLIHDFREAFWAMMAACVPERQTVAVSTVHVQYTVQQSTRHSSTVWIQMYSTGIGIENDVMKKNTLILPSYHRLATRSIAIRHRHLELFCIISAFELFQATSRLLFVPEIHTLAHWLPRDEVYCSCHSTCSVRWKSAGFCPCYSCCSTSVHLKDCKYHFLGNV